MAMRTGVEPAPPGSTGQRSTELSYRTENRVIPISFAIVGLVLICDHHSKHR